MSIKPGCLLLEYTTQCSYPEAFACNSNIPSFWRIL